MTMKQMPAYLNVLKLRINMTLRRKVISNYPIVAYIEPTSLCNLGCPACPTGLRLGLRTSKMIDENLYRSAIDKLGDYIFRLYMYNWGEPLLHKQTPELIQYAKSKEIEIILSSNLSMRLSDDYIDRLVLSGLDTLIVSLDGTTEETYAKYRKRGNFRQVCENMLRIQAAKARLRSNAPEIVWQFLVFRHNEHEIEVAQTKYKSWGADRLSLAGAEMPFEPHNEGFEPSTIPEYNIYDSSHPYNVKLRQLAENGYPPCSWLYGAFVLNPNGKVSPCCATAAEKNDFGEYSGDGSFMKTWNNSKFRQARALFTKHHKPVTPGEPPATFTMDRVNGMASNLSISSGSLICHKCPIPFAQDQATTIVTQIAHEIIASLIEDIPVGQKIRYLFAYMLMGAPSVVVAIRSIIHRYFPLVGRIARRFVGQVT